MKGPGCVRAGLAAVVFAVTTAPARMHLLPAGSEGLMFLYVLYKKQYYCNKFILKKCRILFNNFENNISVPVIGRTVAYPPPAASIAIASLEGILQRSHQWSALHQQLPSTVAASLVGLRREITK